MVLHFAEITDEDRFKDLESKGNEIRKELMGTLLLVKDIYKHELPESPEGREVMIALEKAEDTFADPSLTDRFERLANLLDVIHNRSKALYTLMEYISGLTGKTRYAAAPHNKQQ